MKCCIRASPMVINLPFLIHAYALHRTCRQEGVAGADIGVMALLSNRLGARHLSGLVGGDNEGVYLHMVVTEGAEGFVSHG